LPAEALIAGERDPQVLDGLARGPMRSKHDKLVQAPTGRLGTGTVIWPGCCRARSMP
jgi:hypothetical protein